MRNASTDEAYQSVADELALNGPGFVNGGRQVAGGIRGGSLSRRNHNARIDWGGGVTGRIPLGECAPQEIAIWGFHFVSIDFGDSIRVSGGLNRGRRTSTILSQIVAFCYIWSPAGYGRGRNVNKASRRSRMY